jgi:Secretion system C-terminal sorting domain
MRLLIQEIFIIPMKNLDRFTAKYYIPESQEVSVDLVDMRGQLVKPLLSGFHIAGQHQHTIETQQITGGQYLIRLQSKDQQQSLKMIVSH